MSENVSTKQRQTSSTLSSLGNLNLTAGTGSNRSRRSSWSDSKVRYSSPKSSPYHSLEYCRKFGMSVMKVTTIPILVC